MSAVDGWMNLDVGSIERNKRKILKVNRGKLVERCLMECLLEIINVNANNRRSVHFQSVAIEQRLADSGMTVFPRVDAALRRNALH